MLLKIHFCLHFCNLANYMMPLVAIYIGSTLGFGTQPEPLVFCRLTLKCESVTRMKLNSY